MRFGIDYDGTIADTNRMKSQWIKENMGLDVAPWRCDRTLCDPIIGTEKYSEMARSVYGEKETLKTPEIHGVTQALRDLKGFGDVFVITARAKETLPWVNAWLTEHGIRGHIAGLIPSSGQPKLGLCRKHKIDVLIDDDQRHVFESDAPHIRKILFKNGMTESHSVPEYVTLCRNWSEVVTLVKGWIPNGNVQL